MFKLLRKRSFRRTKDFRTESSRRRRSSEESNNSGHYSNKNSAQPHQQSSVSGSQHSFLPAGSTANQPDSRFSSWDRRSQTSYHRYSSVSQNTLQAGNASGAGRESPPEIIQYARPPENLTSPVRESNGLLNESLTPSPSLLRKTQEEKRQYLREQDRQPSSEQHEAPKVVKRNSGVFTALRQSFRRSKSATHKKRSDTKTEHQPVRRLSQDSSKSHQARKVSQDSRTTSVHSVQSQSSFRNQKGSVSSLKSASHNQSQPSAATPAGQRSSVTTRPQLLPGRASSPGKPVQVVTPFQQQLPQSTQPPADQITAPAQRTDPPDFKAEVGSFHPQLESHHSEQQPQPSMRDPTTRNQTALLNNSNIVNNNNGEMERVLTRPPQQQRCLPQTPKQASRTGLVSSSTVPSALQHHQSGSGSRHQSASRGDSSRHTAVVPPTSASSSSSAPRPAQRHSLRHKVRQGNNNSCSVH